MKIPIIIISVDSKDIDIFYSQKQTIDHMKAIDVLNDEYKAFDADGTPLRIIVSNFPSIRIGLFKFLGGEIVSFEEDVDNMAERLWLKRFLETKLEFMKNHKFDDKETFDWIDKILKF